MSGPAGDEQDDGTAPAPKRKGPRLRRQWINRAEDESWLFKESGTPPDVCSINQYPTGPARTRLRAWIDILETGKVLPDDSLWVSAPAPAAVRRTVAGFALAGIAQAVSTKFMTLEDISHLRRKFYDTRDDDDAFDYECLSNDRTQVLVVDGVGCEPSTSDFAGKLLGSILLERMTRSLPTVIGSVLTVGEAQETYGQPLAGLLTEKDMGGQPLVTFLDAVRLSSFSEFVE